MNIFKLSNGIRVIFEKIEYVKSLTVGVFVGAGSLYEDKNINGISHFLEHMFFKGTIKRSAKEIAQYVDSCGGQLNAVTSKEYTCFYAKVLNNHAEKAFDILSDINFAWFVLLYTSLTCALATIPVSTYLSEYTFIITLKTLVPSIRISFESLTYDTSPRTVSKESTRNTLALSPTFMFDAVGN